MLSRADTLAVPEKGGNVYEAVDAMPKYLGAEARKHKSKAELHTVAVIWLHLAATLIAVIPPAFHFNSTLSAVFVAVELLVFVAIAVVFAKQSHEARSNSLAMRNTAELIRSAKAVWRLPFSEKTFFPILLPRARQWQLSLRLWRQLSAEDDAQLAKEISKTKEDYLVERILGKKKQLEYFNEHREEAAKSVKRWSRTAKLCTGFAFAAVAIAFAMLLAAPSLHVVNSFKSLASILPLLSAGFLSLLSIRDFQRRVTRYKEMATMLERAAAKLAATANPARIENIIAETETALLTEVFEWSVVSQVANSGGH
jgi:ABC-type multidrug transport system fused ATPase/permease subunit